MPKSDAGKKLEKAVRKEFDKLKKNPNFWFHRFPDARTCSGRLGAQPGDFLIKYKGCYALLDPKEIKKDLFNFKERASQVPTMTRFAMAGAGDGWFLIHQTVTNQFYVISAEEVAHLKTNGKKSLKLSTYAGYATVGVAVANLLGYMTNKPYAPREESK